MYRLNSTLFSSKQVKTLRSWSKSLTEKNSYYPQPNLSQLPEIWLAIETTTTFQISNPW